MLITNERNACVSATTEKELNLLLHELKIFCEIKLKKYNLMFLTPSTSCPTEVTIVELRSFLSRSGGSCLNEHDFDRGSVVPPLVPPVGYVRISALRVPSGATDAGKMSRALLCASGIAVHRRFFPR